MRFSVNLSTCQKCRDPRFTRVFSSGSRVAASGIRSKYNLKSIEKTSDELPEVVWKANHYGYEIKSTKERRKRYNKLNQEDEIALAKNGQDSRLE